MQVWRKYKRRKAGGYVHPYPDLHGAAGLAGVNPAACTNTPERRRYKGLIAKLTHYLIFLWQYPTFYMLM